MSDTTQDALAAIKSLVDEQANDTGLWFGAKTAPEAYLQQALRQMHALIESALLAKGSPEPDARRCHFPGERCAACPHYYGKTDVCSYAPGQPLAAAPAVPEGWRLVPVEPTPGMWNEVLRGMNEADAEHWKRSMTITWRLLIAAAYKEQSK